MTNKNLIKKIIYRSNHRGSKEMDILLGEFVKKYLRRQNLQKVCNNFMDKIDTINQRCARNQVLSLGDRDSTRTITKNRIRIFRKNRTKIGIFRCTKTTLKNYRRVPLLNFEV